MLHMLEIVVVAHVCLVVDICVQHAIRGNSALQGAVNAALSVLADIEALEDSLRNQMILEVGIIAILHRSSNVYRTFQLWSSISCTCAGQQSHCMWQVRGDVAAQDMTESAATAAAKLEALIKRLDSLLPYLSVAISAVGLLDHGTMC